MWKNPALNILITHVAKPTFESNGVLVVGSQCLVNVMHQVMYTLLNIHVACVNGQSERSCVNIESWLFSCGPILIKKHH
jgi:hypothetical protein